LLFEDVTKRKRIEQAVKENEERYRALFEKSPDGIYVVATNGEYAGRIVSANTRMVDMLGYSMKELIGMTTENLIRDVKKEARKTFTQRMMAGETITFDTYIYRNDNSYFPVEVTNSIISIADQILILCVNRDISERKRSEQLLRESEQKLLNIFNSSSDGVIISDMNCNMIEVNQTLLDIIGIDSTSSIYGKNVDNVLPGLSELLINIPHEINVDEKLSNIEIEIVKKGAKIVVDVISKIINHAGKPAILIIVRDITEKKDIEKKLFEKIIFTEEKERERFAGDLHDEVGPLLSSLKMYISLLAETDDKKKKEYIIPQIQTLIKESITTVREISNDLSPHVLNNYGCVAAINSFLGMKTDFLNISFKHSLENVRYNQSIEIVIYRIIKELVNNTIKHAKAKSIEIEMYEQNSILKLTYKDDGQGFDINNTINSPSGSIGLLNIISRVKTVNGKYKISSTAGKGFAFELQVPISKSST
jgi:PAS domain S-box-containing protein